MFTERRPLGLKIVVFLAVLNCLATVVHFILLGRGILKVTVIVPNLWIYAAAVTLTAVLPVTFGAYGLYQRKMWGLGSFTLGSGAFLLAAVLMLFLDARANHFGPMFYVALYLLVYFVLAEMYAWFMRHHFKDL